MWISSPPGGLADKTYLEISCLTLFPKVGHFPIDTLKGFFWFSSFGVAVEPEASICCIWRSLS